MTALVAMGSNSMSAVVNHTHGRTPSRTNAVAHFKNPSARICSQQSPVV
jgi:hypothetical protein